MASLGLVIYALGTPCKGQEIVFEGNASDALLLDDGVIAVASENRVFLVQSTGRGTMTRVNGSFASVGSIGRAPNGDLVVWDDSLWAAFVFDHAVERRVIPFSQPGLVSGEVSFVALFTGDTGLFEEVDIGNPFALSSGPYRHPVRYVAIAADGARKVVWEALGKEASIHPTDGGMSSAPIIFGYGVLACRVDDDRFIVAQTELGEAAVVGRDGRRLGAVPMPSFGPTVSDDQVEQERARLIATRSARLREDLSMEAFLGTVLSEDQVREAVAKMTAGSRQALQAASANSMPPRISDLRVDGEGRVWMQRFVLPGDTLAVWEVRSVEGSANSSFELPAAWVVFDLRDGLGLVGMRDESGAVTSVGLAELPIG
jgi:hypothetical protein